MKNKFDNYLKQGKIKRKTPDPEEAKSLLEKAKSRLNYIKIKQIDDHTSSFILEDAYEAVRESAQSLMSIRGFKPYSHEATISFIKKFYSSDFKEQELYKFDHFRRLRNDSIYKAVEIMKEDAYEVFRFAKDFVKRIESISK